MEAFCSLKYFMIWRDISWEIRNTRRLHVAGQWTTHFYIIMSININKNGVMYARRNTIGYFFNFSSLFFFCIYIFTKTVKKITLSGVCTQETLLCTDVSAVAQQYVMTIEIIIFMIDTHARTKRVSTFRYKRVLFSKVKFIFYIRPTKQWHTFE